MALPCSPSENFNGDPLTPQNIITFIHDKGDSTECYDKVELMEWFNKEEDEMVYEWSRGPILEFPVYKLVYTGKWIDAKTKKLMDLGYDTIFLIGSELKEIGSSFGVSRLHGAKERVYFGIPIPRIILRQYGLSRLQKLVVERNIGVFKEIGFRFLSKYYSKTDPDSVIKDLTSFDITDNIFKGNEIMVARLINGDESVNPVNLSHYLSEAAEISRWDIVKIILVKMESISAETLKEIMKLAIRQNNEEMFNYFVDLYEEFSNYEYFVLLKEAIICDNFNIILRILKNTKETKGIYYDAMNIASEYRRLDVVEFLFKHLSIDLPSINIALINSIVLRDPKLLQFILRNEKFQSYVSSLLSPLKVAIGHSDEEIFNILISSNKMQKEDFIDSIPTCIIYNKTNFLSALLSKIKLSEISETQMKEIKDALRKAVVLNYDPIVMMFVEWDKNMANWIIVDAIDEEKLELIDKLLPLCEYPLQVLEAAMDQNNEAIVKFILDRLSKEDITSALKNMEPNDTYRKLMKSYLG